MKIDLFIISKYDGWFNDLFNILFTWKFGVTDSWEKIGFDTKKSK